MGKWRAKRPPRRRPRWRRAALGMLGLMAVGVVTLWGVWETQDASGGTPRLVLDREVVDLGYVPFEVPARVAFIVTNAGDGPLRLVEVPRVKVLRGC